MACCVGGEALQSRLEIRFARKRLFDDDVAAVDARVVNVVVHVDIDGRLEQRQNVDPASETSRQFVVQRRSPSQKIIRRQRSEPNLT